MKQRDRAAPGLLVVFFAATLAMVLVVVVLLRGTSDWVDFAAIALLFAVAAVLLIFQMRALRDEDQDDGDPER